MQAVSGASIPVFHGKLARLMTHRKTEGLL